jgi:hypothetical protein
MNPAIHEQRFQLKNDRIDPLLLILEPWAEEWIIKAGDTIQLIAQGPMSDEYFDLHFKLKSLVIYAWQGCTVTVLYNKKIVASASQSIPAM